MKDFLTTELKDTTPTHDSAGNCLHGGSEEPELFFHAVHESYNSLCLDLNNTLPDAQKVVEDLDTKAPHVPKTSFVCGVIDMANLVHCAEHVELEIVVSQFSSPVATLHKQLHKLVSGAFMSNKSIVISIYSKDQTLDIGQYQATLRNLFLFRSSQLKVNVYRSPNIGRENLTFIHHILAQWSSLADHTLFAQEDIHSVTAVRNRLEQHLRPSTAFLSLSPFHEVCSDLTCTDARANGHQWPGIRSLWSGKSVSARVEPLLMVYKSQFVMSKTRIKARPLSDYIAYHQSLSASASSGHHANADAQEYYHDRGLDSKDYWTDPHYGHTFERSWAIIANCNEMKIYESCNLLRPSWFSRLTLQSQSDMICGCED